MKKVLFLIITAAFAFSCQKSEIAFNSRANDNLIYPDAELKISKWEKLDSLTNLSLGDVSFCNENTGIIAGFGSIVYITKDGGKTWRTLDLKKQMTFHCVYALDENTFFAARIGLYKSTDGGSNWKMCNFPSSVSVFHIWFNDSENGFISSNNGLYKSSDSGETWTKIAPEWPENLQFTSKDIGYFSYGSTAVSFSSDPYGSLPSFGDIYRTVNGGDTWHKMGLNVREIRSMSFISDKIGFFQTNDGSLYKTSDGGESCILIQKTDRVIYDMFFLNENQGIMCVGNGIAVSFDGGNTFTDEYIKTGYGQIYEFDFPSPATGYAVGNSGYIIKRNQ